MKHSLQQAIPWTRKPTSKFDYNRIKLETDIGKEGKSLKIYLENFSRESVDHRGLSQEVKNCAWCTQPADEGGQHTRANLSYRVGHCQESQRKE